MLGYYLMPDEPGREPIQCTAGISEMCCPHTVVVNKAGKRFADESYFQSVVPELRKFDALKHDYANLPCFLIFDQQFAANYSLAHLPVGAVPASVARADTILELAGKLRIDADGLERTVARFNSFAATGVATHYPRSTHSVSLPWPAA
jgi:3-oxosteroid 1-dehydrogenase